MRVLRIKGLKILKSFTSRSRACGQIVFASFACSALRVSTDYVIINLTTVEFYRLYINLYLTLLSQTIEMKTKQF